MNAIHLVDVTKRYRTHCAVENLSLSVPAGSIFGLLGENGAGKSTTLRMLMNIRVPDEGIVRVLDVDPRSDRRVLRRVGYLPEERGLYQKMSVLSVLEFFGVLKGLGESDARRRAIGWLDRMELGAVRDRRVETLSKGMQQKVQFIATVLHEPELLVLDEPFTGLDPINQQVMREAISTCKASGRTVLFSTHVMEHAEQLCDRIAILARGRKVLEGAVADLRRGTGELRFVIRFAKQTDAVSRFLTIGELFSSVDARPPGGDEEWDVTLTAGVEPQRVLAALAALDSEVERFERKLPTLHELFLSHVQGRAHA